MFLNLATCLDEIKYQSINKTLKLNKLEKNAGYSVPYQENMRKIRKEKVTVKRIIL